MKKFILLNGIMVYKQKKFLPSKLLDPSPKLLHVLNKTVFLILERIFWSTLVIKLLHRIRRITTTC